MSFDFKTIEIKYLVFFIKYLDDIVFKDLISFIFEKEFFEIKPFTSYKDFFFYLLVSDKSSLVYKNEIKYEELVDAKKEVIKLLSDKKELSVDLYEKNIYCKLKLDYEKIRKINKTKLQCDDIDDLLNYYNNKYIHTQNVDKILLRYIEYICNSIESLFGEKYPESKKFKKFLNYIVRRNLNEKCCCGIYNSNGYYYIQHITLYPYSKTKTIFQDFYIRKYDNNMFLTNEKSPFKIPFNNFIDLYREATNINGHKKLIKNINKKIEVLNKKIQKQSNCHICNPVIKNTPKNKKHMCINCQNLVDAIYKIDTEKLKKQSIVYAIKKKDKDLKIIQKLSDIRQLRYNNLISYLTYLNNENKIRNKNEIETLIAKVFSDFPPFHFEKNKLN